MGEGDEGGTLHPLPAPESVTTRSGEIASGTGAALGGQERSPYLPGAASELRAKEGAGGPRLATGSTLWGGGVHGVVALSAVIHASRRGCGGGATGGQQARTKGGIKNGEHQELMGVGVNAGILVEEGRGEMPIQVSNTDTKHVDVFRYVALSS